MDKKGQNATELALLLAALLIVAFVVYSIFTFFVETTPDIKISESRAYWSGISYGIRLTDWKMSAARDPSIPAVEANLTIIAKNTLSNKITLRKILIEQGDFGHVWFSDGSYAGHSDSTSIVLNPGDEIELTIQHFQTGANAYIPPEIYELDASFVYDTPGIPSNVLNGSIPIVGRRGEYNDQATFGSSICPGGTSECPASSGSCCGVNNCVDGVCKSDLCEDVVCDVPGCEVCSPVTGTCGCIAATTPPTYYCGGDSLCHLRDVRSCAEGILGFDSDTMLCANNCPEGQYCDADCTCDGTCPSWQVCGASGELCCGRNQKCDGTTNTCVDCPPNTIGCGTHCCPEAGSDVTCDVTAVPVECTFCCSADTFNCGGEYCCSNDQLCIGGICEDTLLCTSTQTACPLDIAGETYECCDAGILCSMDSTSRGCIDPPTDPECNWLPVCGGSYCCGENQYCYDGLCVDSLPASPVCEYGTVCAPSVVCYKLNEFGNKLSAGICCATGENCVNATGTCCPSGQETCTNATSGLLICCDAGYSCAKDPLDESNVCCSNSAFQFNQLTSIGTDSYFLSSTCSNTSTNICCDSASTPPGAASCLPPGGGVGVYCCANSEVCLTGLPGSDSSSMTWECCSDTTFCGDYDSGVDPGADADLKLTAAGLQEYLCCSNAQQCDVPAINGTPGYDCCPSDTSCFNNILCCANTTDPNTNKLCEGANLGDLFCCAEGQACVSIVPIIGSNPDRSMCCEPTKYSQVLEHCCSNPTVCSSDYINSPGVGCTNKAPTYDSSGFAVCLDPSCIVECCEESQLKCGNVSSSGTGGWQCLIGVGGDPNTCYVRWDDPNHEPPVEIDGARCGITCGVGEDCPTTCGNGQCCDNVLDCANRPSPYLDNTCCDAEFQTRNSYTKFIDTSTSSSVCCPNNRIAGPPGLPEQCCDYGSVPYQGPDGSYGCCGGITTYVDKDNPSLGQICCSAATQEACQTGAGSSESDYTCCADGSCNKDLAPAVCCTEGQICGVSGGCCTYGTPVCYTETTPPFDPACCSTAQSCIISDAPACCDTGTTCKSAVDPGLLGGSAPQGDNTCCDSASICGSQCCMNGAICDTNYATPTCVGCMSDSACTGSQWGNYCNTATGACVQCTQASNCGDPVSWNCINNACVPK